MRQSAHSPNVPHQHQGTTNFDSERLVPQPYHTPNIHIQHMHQSIPGYNSLLSPGVDHHIQNSVEPNPHRMNSPTARPPSFVKSKHSHIGHPPQYPDGFQGQGHSGYGHGQSNMGYHASMPPPPPYVSPSQNLMPNPSAIHQVSCMQNATHQSLTPSPGNNQVVLVNLLCLYRIANTLFCIV